MYKSLRITRGTHQSSNLEPVPKMDNNKADLLARCTDIRIWERLEMLQILLGYKWLGEAKPLVTPTRPDAPSDEQRYALGLLDKLGIAAEYTMEDNGDFYQSWVQFAVNKQLLHMFLESEDGMTELERGMLYGYPAASILAFAGVISATEKVTPHDEVELFFLGGRLSKEYADEARTLAIERWDVMKKAAPALIAEATGIFEKLKQQNFPLRTTI